MQKDLEILRYYILASPKYTQILLLIIFSYYRLLVKRFVYFLYESATFIYIVELIEISLFKNLKL